MVLVLGGKKKGGHKTNTGLIVISEKYPTQTGSRHRVRTPTLSNSLELWNVTTAITYQVLGSTSPGHTPSTEFDTFQLQRYATQQLKALNDLNFNTTKKCRGYIGNQQKYICT
ncbi:hypothetical protein N7478_009499 [Penicillium angulare]|uniref:uncharacterized protein n=1 Tax=Penicillium angulare TaxID=116970 RepID=UPI0025422ED3|nr:uncharacterized protein N7478_009499 [Penicillium angulare]KAJ5266691.1 hypothetical protein N7478_009499 [Penicillium angulare]